MKKLLVAAAILLIFLSSNLYAQDTGLYIGIGGNYAIQNIDKSYLNNELGTQVEFSNAYGLNAKVGYHFSRLFAAEFDFDYLTNFLQNQTITISGRSGTLDAKDKLMTFMIAGKLSPEWITNSEVVRAYITAGAGMMQGNADGTASAPGSWATASYSNSGACAKIGAGIDIYATKNISIGIEASYVMGFGNVDEIRYTNLNVGVSYHF